MDELKNIKPEWQQIGFIKIYFSDQLIKSFPKYGTSAAGIFIPSGDWWFSNMQAMILGSASELPFKECTSCVFPLLSLYRAFSLLVWNVSKLDTELTSNQRSCAALYTSKS